jgi:hypothetical protein
MLKQFITQGRFALILTFSTLASVILSAIAPKIVTAYPQTVEIYLTRQGGETYENLLERSAIIARAATQRTFDTDVLVTEVAVIILADNEGLIAPLLTLNVSREDWWEKPDPKAWIDYYDGISTLLQFHQPKTP